MPKGKLEFDLPQEEREFQTAQQGSAWKLVCWDLDQTLRNLLKHGDLRADERDAYDAIRKRLHSLLEEGNLTFD